MTNWCWTGVEGIRNNDFLSTHCLADRSRARQGKCVPECVSMRVCKQVQKLFHCERKAHKEEVESYKRTKRRVGGGDGGTKAE